MLQNKHTLLIFNANLNKRRQLTKEKGVENIPYADFFALIDTIKADYIDQTTVDNKLWSRLVKKFLGYSVALALIAFFSRKKYDTFYADNEVTGLPIAFLFKIFRHHARLLFITHWLTPYSRTIFLDYFRVQSHIETIFVHTLAQQTVALARCGFTSNQVQLIPYQIDPSFWSMQAYEKQLTSEERTPPIPPRPYICSAGLECRDYGTLLTAVKNLNVDVKLAVGSHWSQTKDVGLPSDLPSNVEAKFYNYKELRELYANAAFVVVPTKDVDHAAGVTTIMEAMSMGKAVVATRSVGQSDVLNDRRSTTRNKFHRVASGTFLKMFGTRDIDNLQTGFYVNPGEVEEMHRAVKYLLENPERANLIGRNARQVIEQTMTLEHFCRRIKEVVNPETETTEAERQVYLGVS